MDTHQEPSLTVFDEDDNPAIHHGLPTTSPNAASNLSKSTNNLPPTSGSRVARIKNAMTNSSARHTDDDLERAGPGDLNKAPQQ